MTRTAKAVFGLIGPRTLARFHEQCRQPMAQQEALLQSLLRGNEGSAFGEAHHFSTLGGLSDFRARVPLAEYDDLLPYIEAARTGRKAQLTEAPPVFYALTSGTTGPAKYIPVTRASRRAKARLMRLWLCALFRTHPDIMDGVILQPASPEVEEHAPDGTPCGAEAGHAYRNMPRVLRGMYPLPYEICEIPCAEARYYTLLRLAVMHDVKVIGTPNPSTILLLSRALGAHSEALVRDVRNGTCAPQMDIPAAIRKEISRDLRADPRRAAFLEAAAHAGGGRLSPRHVWPHLAVLACWKGGSVQTYLDQLDPFLPPGLPIRDLGWLSSECRGSVPLSDDGDSGPLAVATNVYEFLPAEESGSPEAAHLLMLDQLELGGQYLVYVTTAGGLWRYAMHDILEVTGWFEATPSVRFVQKEKGIVSFTGEKLTEVQVLRAVGEVFDPHRSDRVFIAAVGRPPTLTSEACYVILVEYETPPDAESGRTAARDVDRALCRHNIEYACKRASGRLAPAVLRVLAPGQFEAFQRRSLAQGAHDGQFKILRLTADQTFADHFPGLVSDYQGA